MKVHIALATEDLERSVPFYERLFGMDVTKRKSDYAKFEPEQAELVLSLVPTQQGAGLPQPYHFGIRVQSAEQLKSWMGRLAQEDVSMRLEEQVTCCYAVQNKAWVQDPDGHSWELYVVTDDGAKTMSPKGDCCT